MNVGVGGEVDVGKGVAVLVGVGVLVGVWAEIASTVRWTRTATVASASISGMAVSLASAAAMAAWTVASILGCSVAWQPINMIRPTKVIRPQKRPRM